MSAYRVLCTEQTGCTSRGHIVAVGASDGGTNVDGRWTVDQVWTAIDVGAQFYTYGGGLRARVAKHTCNCGRRTLRSTSDATTANNLDNLRLCNWAA